MGRQSRSTGLEWDPNRTSIGMQRAARALVTFLTAFTSIFVAAFALLSVMVSLLVVRPITRLARAADEVSLGRIEVADFPTPNADEVSLLAHSFNRMKKSLVHAIKMLEQ